MMFKRRNTILFWCGFSVLVMAIVQLLGSIGFAWTDYVNYSRYNLLPTGVNPLAISFYLLGIVRGLVWSIIWGIFIVIGLYIMKSGAKKEVVIPKTV